MMPSVTVSTGFPLTDPHGAPFDINPMPCVSPAAPQNQSPRTSSPRSMTGLSTLKKHAVPATAAAATSTPGSEGTPFQPSVIEEYASPSTAPLVLAVPGPTPRLNEVPEAGPSSVLLTSGASLASGAVAGAAAGPLRKSLTSWKKSF